ncbi:MAG: hypothetical protein BGO09_16510 [Bacteroidetes bacterium 47-18]|nr:MAG: hypothetical protein BGO09_16510 [Bacteroidetes bacterium 47-18]
MDRLLLNAQHFKFKQSNIEIINKWYKQVSRRDFHPVEEKIDDEKELPEKQTTLSIFRLSSI